jgi:hypothetical protein
VAAGGIQPAAFGFAAPSAAVVRTGRASECWTHTAADVDAWLKIAEAGDTFVYAHGPQLVQGGAAARVGELHRSGDVTPHHKRAGDGGFDFIVRRCAPKKRAPRPPVCDPMMLAVLVELHDAAMNARRCPSDGAIAQAAGLTADQVKWLLRKLEQAKFITRQTVRTKADPRFRVITITATGQSTAGPVE